MSDEVRRLMTEEQRERLYLARRRGGMCAACGRALGADETVYIEQFEGPGSWVTAPVGIECASPELLEQTKGQQPERCAGCGRGVYYRMASSRRQQTLCSRYCVTRAVATKRSARFKEGRSGE